MSIYIMSIYLCLCFVLNLEILHDRKVKLVICKCNWRWKKLRSIQNKSIDYMKSGKS